LPDPEIKMVERSGPEADEHLSRAGRRILHVLVAEHLGTAVLVDAHSLHAPILTGTFFAANFRL
jgi:hypothetical protein